MDREELVEAMAIASCDRMNSPGVSTWAELTELGREEWRLDMRAALAVAEPVVREWERQEGRVRRSPAWQQVRDDQAAYEDQLRSVVAGDEIGRTGGTL